MAPLAVTGRLAPTPSGRLHLGNTLAFGAAWLSVRAAGGRLLLRMEDVDRSRARPDLEVGIREDLTWLGLDWDAETPPQRDRDYAPWLARLAPVTYACRCSRRDLPSCRCRDAGHPDGTIRFRVPPGPVDLWDRKFGAHRVDPAPLGDPTLRQRDGLYAYTLAVVVDDVCDGVTEVVRGADLLDFTAVQVHLWRAIGATPPTWLHAPLLLGGDGRKLSKSHGSTEIAAMRAAGTTAEQVWRTVLPFLGLFGYDHVRDAVSAFRPDAGGLGPFTVPTSR